MSFFKHRIPDRCLKSPSFFKLTNQKIAKTSSSGYYYQNLMYYINYKGHIAGQQM